MKRKEERGQLDGGMDWGLSPRKKIGLSGHGARTGRDNRFELKVANSVDHHAMIAEQRSGGIAGLRGVGLRRSRQRSRFSLRRSHGRSRVRGRGTTGATTTAATTGRSTSLATAMVLAARLAAENAVEQVGQRVAAALPLAAAGLLAATASLLTAARLLAATAGLFAAARLLAATASLLAAHVAPLDAMAARLLAAAASLLTAARLLAATTGLFAAARLWGTALHWATVSHGRQHLRHSKRSFSPANRLRTGVQRQHFVSQPQQAVFSQQAAKGAASGFAAGNRRSHRHAAQPGSLEFIAVPLGCRGPRSAGALQKPSCFSLSNHSFTMNCGSFAFRPTTTSRSSASHITPWQGRVLPWVRTDSSVVSAAGWKGGSAPAVRTVYCARTVGPFLGPINTDPVA